MAMGDFGDYLYRSYLIICDEGHNGTFSILLLLLLSQVALWRAPLFLSFWTCLKCPVLSWHEIAFLSFGWCELHFSSAAWGPQLLGLDFCQEQGGSHNSEPDWAVIERPC